MKNYITVAALLAAGTALSGAATGDLLWGLDFTSGSLTLTGEGTASGSGSIDTTGGLFGTGSYSTGNSNSGKLTLNLGGDTSALQEGSGAFTLSFHAKYEGGQNEWPVLATFGVDGNYQYKLSYYANDGTLQLDKDGYPEMTGAGTNGKTFVGSGFTPSSDWAHYALVFGGEAGAKTISLYIDGVKQGSTGTLNLTSSNAMTSFVLGGKINGNNASYLTLSDVAIYEGELDETQVAYLSENKAPVSFSAIPEPSAFGLLAGLGALALVASRRRRK